MAGGHRGTAVESLERLFESGTVVGLGEAQLLERFLVLGDEAAFEAILHRHGPMVLGVCRRVLADPHSIADAFQATFLILVKNGRSIRDRDALGIWLYGVARRVAVRARANARRRDDRERSGIVAEGQILDTGSGGSGLEGLERQELRATIDEELERLPATYRAPLILCDLEGQTYEQAAAQLGCPVGTVKSRLARGRERLRARLTRRGVAPCAATLASAIAAESAHAGPVELMGLTLGAASRIAAGQEIAAGASSAGATALTKGVLRTMKLVRIQLATAALLAATLATTGVRALVGPAAAAVSREAVAPKAPRVHAAATTPKVEPAPSERGVEHFRLANGLKVILRPIKGSEETALVVVYDIGEDHDPEGHSGLAHAIEHLYATARAGLAPAREADGESNGQTGERYTAISNVFPAGQLARVLADAAALMRGLKLTPADLDRERPRLLEEVENMFEGFPALAAVNNARARVRPMPAGGRQGGRPEYLRTLTIGEIRARLDRYYKPTNATLALAGDFDPAAARRAIESHFAAIPSGEPIPAALEPGAPNFFVPAGPAAGQADRAHGKPTMACLAYRPPQPGDELYPPFLVLVSRLWAAGSRLGGGGITGSPVFFTPLDDGTVVAISLPIRDGEPPAKAFERIEAFVAETIATKLGPGELAGLIQEVRMIFEVADLPDARLDPYGVAFAIARRDQLGIDPARFDRALQAITEEDLRRVGKDVFDPGRHAGAIAGDAKARP